MQGATAIQVGAIPFRTDPSGRVEILLISTSRLGWLVPKGNLEAGIEPHSMAAREAFEEAGALGTIDGDPLGAFHYRKHGVEHTVVVFALRVERTLKKWQEMRERERRWVTPRKAIKLLRLRELSKLVDLLAHQLESQRIAG